MNILTDALQYPFMQQALAIALLLGITCALLSCYIVLKGWALMGDAISLTILALKWRDLMLLFFDDIQATTVGLAVNRLRWLFFLLVSAAVVAALQTVGAILVIALLITPGATAFLLCRSFGKVLITAFAIGVSTAVIGTYASYFLDSITGAVIVVLQGGLFLAVFAVRRLQHLARLRHEPHP